jgi:polysaccharide export outer membrane protein
MCPRSVAVLVLAVAACGPSAVTVVERQDPIPQADTTLGVGDTIDVRIYGEPEFSGAYRVGADGTVTFPISGPIEVLGLDPQQAGKKITQRLGDGVLRNPQVIVTIKEQVSKKIYVSGQVGRAGIVPFSPPMSLVDAINAAGGFTALALKNSTTLTRREGGKKTTMTLPAGDIVEGRQKNLYLQPGDIIYVPERLF